MGIKIQKMEAGAVNQEMIERKRKCAAHADKKGKN